MGVIAHVANYGDLLLRQDSDEAFEESSRADSPC
jgi:hypothetical protein